MYLSVAHPYGEGNAASSLTVSMWMRKPDYFVSEYGDALAAWVHEGALSNDPSDR